MGALLQREGLVIGRKKRRKVPPYTPPLQTAQEPNQLWCADFKGWFCTGDGERIDPLTISDEDLKKLPAADRAKVYRARLKASGWQPPTPTA